LGDDAEFVASSHYDAGEESLRCMNKLKEGRNVLME
jgi:hypothetical protein